MQQQSKELSFEKALQILVDGVQIAQKRGAYSLQESSIVYQAILKIQENVIKKAPKPQEKVEEM